MLPADLVARSSVESGAFVKDNGVNDLAILDDALQEGFVVSRAGRQCKGLGDPMRQKVGVHQPTRRLQRPNPLVLRLFPRRQHVSCQTLSNRWETCSRVGGAGGIESTRPCTSWSMSMILLSVN